MASSSQRRGEASTTQSLQLTRWPFWRRWFGQKNERLAAKYLRKHRYRILACNWSERYGEIDLVALDPDQRTLVIVEVRSSPSADISSLLASVNLAKQKRLTHTTLHFLKRFRFENQPIRFDVLAISEDHRLHPSEQIVHVMHAFEAFGRYQMQS